MIKGKDIVCVSFPNWEGEYMKTIVQVMTLLAKENNVLYVDYEFTLKDMMMTMAGKQSAPVKRMLGIDKRLRKLPLEGGGSVNVLTPPPVLPINWMEHNKRFESLQRLNAKWVGRTINSAIQKLGMKDVIVINAFNPFFGVDLAGTFNESMLIYYCYDEIKAAKWSQKHGEQMEEAFIKKVDAVITTAPALFQDKQKIHDQCYLVRNGVNFKLFNRAANIPSSSTRPVVGYLGSLDERLDYDLLTQVAKKAPDLDFVFVGRTNHPKGKAALERVPNIKLLGPQLPDKLPEHLASFSVGLIPFVKSELTRGIYPLKINEYLAGGKPVVMTNFSELSEFKKYVSIADRADGFLNAIRQEIESNNDEKIKARIVIARQNSWEGRVEEISDIIEELDSKDGGQKHDAIAA